MSSISNAVLAGGSEQQNAPLNDISQKEHGHMATGELQTRGKQLRRAIDERYKKLDAAGSIKHNGKGRNDISDIVTNYIPIGISFDEAEIILRSAGFKVGPRGKHPIITSMFLVFANIARYRPTLFGKTSVIVILEPESSNDWRQVKKIEAGIVKQFL